MIDFIKFEIKDETLGNTVWENSDLEYLSETDYLNRHTGEVKTIQKKTHRNLIFAKYDNRLEISGSLHKYRNNGIHNADDFSISDCIKTINSLCANFHIDPKICYPTNLEFGVNIIAPIDVSDLVKWLRFHNRTQFIKFPDLKECYFAGTSYFGVKAYNKTANFPQYALPNLFRFEGKTRQSKYLNAKDITTLADLTKPTVLKRLGTVLLSEWGNVLIFDKRHKKTAKFCNTDYWLDVINSKHRNTFINQKKIYYKKLGKKGLQNLISKGIEEKLNVLNDCAIYTISGTENGINDQTENLIKPDIGIVQFPTIVKLETAQRPHPEPRRLCMVTKLDISMQKKTSKFICSGGLRWYSENEPETYQKLTDEYLTNEKKILPLPQQFYYIAHNIRNAKTNPIHNPVFNRKRFEQRHYHKNQLQFNF